MIEITTRSSTIVKARGCRQQPLPRSFLPFHQIQPFFCILFSTHVLLTFRQRLHPFFLMHALLRTLRAPDSQLSYSPYDKTASRPCQGIATRVYTASWKVEGKRPCAREVEIEVSPRLYADHGPVWRIGIDDRSLLFGRGGIGFQQHRRSALRG